MSKARYFVPIVAILTLAEIFVFPAREAQAAPPAGWFYRQTITVDCTKVATNLTNFAVLVNFTNANLRSAANGGRVTQSDGGDIRFENASNVKLDHEIEKYVDTTGELVAWVEADTLSSNVNTVINMYYSSPDTNKQWNITNTWESSLKMVQHLNGTNSTRYDSTANMNNGAPRYGVSSNVSGQVNGANGFNGVDGCLDVGINSSLAIVSGPWSLITWIKTGATGVVQNIYSDAYDYNMRGLRFQLGSASNNLVMNSRANNGGYKCYITVATIPTNEWHQVGIAIGALNSVKFYIDGIEVSYNKLTDQDQDSLPAPRKFIGACGYDAGSSEPYSTVDFFNGTIDEVRIYNRALSPGEVLTQYNNQNSPSTFYSVSAEEYVGPRGIVISIR